MVKSRRSASSRPSSVKATTAWRPSVVTSRRRVVTSNGLPSTMAVSVPCSMPVGTKRDAGGGQQRADLVGRQAAWRCRCR